MKELFGLRVKLPPVYHAQWRLHNVRLNAELQAGKLSVLIFLVFGLTRPGIKVKSIVSEADALFTQPPNGSFYALN